MKKLIKNREIIEDTWTTVENTETLDTLPEGDIIVSLALWEQHRDALKARGNRVGVILTSSEEPSSIKDDLASLSVIALDFPKFSDGRGYSSARELRSYFNYQGEIRAVGDVLRDQLYQMERCGFDCFAVREDRSIEEALSGFNDFSVGYQPDHTNPQPLFKR